MKNLRFHFKYIIGIALIVGGIVFYYENYRIRDINYKYELEKIHLEHRYKTILNRGLYKKDTTVFNRQDEVLLEILKEKKENRLRLDLNEGYDAR